MAKKSVSFQDILSNLRQKKYSPVYFLYGEESYFIDRICDYLVNDVLTEAEKGFNLTVVYGKDTDSRSILAAARRYPMMSEYQVVLVKEAQNLKDLEPLISYLEKPVGSTILVFAWKNKGPDGRTKFFKSLDAHVTFESKKLYDNEVPGWISRHLAEQGYKITEKASALIAESIGADLGRIVHELDKVLLNMGDRKEITEKEVEEDIGISREYNVFELQSAIARRDFNKAIRIVNYFSSSKNPFGKPVVLLGTLFGYFSKILMVHSSPSKEERSLAAFLGVSPFFIREYVAAARNYPAAKVEAVIEDLSLFDLKSKGVKGGSESEESLLKELMIRIFS